MAEDALEGVKGRNAAALSELGDPKATQDYSRILSILDSKEKIPYVGRVLNGLYYNFWQDENHIRGIWRRTTLPEYRKTSPAWETVLDLDALGKEEGESWVWKGSVVLDEGIANLLLNVLTEGVNIVEREGVFGLWSRGLTTKLVSNGLQAMLFTVCWRYFEEKLAARSASSSGKAKTKAA